LPSRFVQIVLAVLASLLWAALLGGCGGDGSGAGDDESADALPGDGKPAVTIGTKDFPEQFILGELYAQALEAQGYTVNLKKNIGPT
jgi:osmoprotectant transport system substrate-binding protein